MPLRAGVPARESPLFRLVEQHFERFLRVCGGIEVKIVPSPEGEDVLVQLNDAEAATAFRTLKRDLAIRPSYHQLEARVKAHVLICFLSPLRSCSEQRRPRASRLSDW